MADGKLMIVQERFDALLRKEFGGNMSRLARRLGVSRAQVCRAMHGKSNAGEKLLYGFCLAFPERRIGDFFAWNGTLCNQGRQCSDVTNGAGNDDNVS